MSRLKTEYVLWYFGMPAYLADAIKIRVPEIMSWGEYLPEKYDEKVKKIMEADANEEAKTSKAKG